MIREEWLWHRQESPWIWMGLRRSEPSLEMWRDFPGSRWILRFPVNGGDRPRGRTHWRKSRLEGSWRRCVGHSLPTCWVSGASWRCRAGRASGSGTQVRGTLEGSEVQRPEKGKVRHEESFISTGWTEPTDIALLLCESRSPEKLPSLVWDDQTQK